MPTPETVVTSLPAAGAEEPDRSTDSRSAFYGSEQPGLKSRRTPRTAEWAQWNRFSGRPSRIARYVDISP
jgi:hypothetical protein